MMMRRLFSSTLLLLLLWSQYRSFECVETKTDQQLDSEVNLSAAQSRYYHHHLRNRYRGRQLASKPKVAAPPPSTLPDIGAYTANFSKLVFPFPPEIIDRLPHGVDSLEQVHCLMQSFQSRFGQLDRRCSAIVANYTRITPDVFGAEHSEGRSSAMTYLSGIDIEWDASSQEWLSGDLHCLAFAGNDLGVILFRHMEGGTGAEGKYAQWRYAVEGYKMQLNHGAKVNTPHSLLSAGSAVVRQFIGGLGDSDFDKSAKVFANSMALVVKGTFKTSKVVFGGYSLGGTLAQVLAGSGGLNQLHAKGIEVAAVVGVAGNGPVTTKKGKMPNHFWGVNFVDVQASAGEDGRYHDNVPLIGCYYDNEFVCFQNRGWGSHFTAVYGDGSSWVEPLYEGIRSTSADRPSSAEDLDLGVNGGVYCMLGASWNRMCGTCREESIRKTGQFPVEVKEDFEALQGLICPHIKW